MTSRWQASTFLSSLLAFLTYPCPSLAPSDGITSSCLFLQSCWVAGSIKGTECCGPCGPLSTPPASESRAGRKSS